MTRLRVFPSGVATHDAEPSVALSTVQATHEAACLSSDLTDAASPDAAVMDVSSVGDYQTPDKPSL